MNETDKVTGELLEHRDGKAKRIHKKWVNAPAGAKAIFTDILLAAQLGVLAFLYAVLAWFSSIFFYISLGLTFLAAVHAFICESDAQSKASWLLLFIASFGCGYIIYLLADKRVCYGYEKRRFAEISRRAKSYSSGLSLPKVAPAVANDIEYVKSAGGYLPYTGTDITYFSDAKDMFDDVTARLESAEKFIFMEFFILSDGALAERILSVLKRKVQEGLEVKFLYDDAGCQGVLSRAMKERFRAAGIDLKVFSRMLAPFSFGLNYRDHRKIIVVDGKTGYAGGCNIADECTNEVKMNGVWKDAGVRLDGAAVDGLTITFLRQWEFGTREAVDFPSHLNLFEKTENSSIVLPYAGGPEIDEPLCRGVYANMIAGARERLYIMSPYFIPDGDLIGQIKAKALSGVDVRLVLPAVPDYSFIYRVTRSNAERLLKCGVKVYYVKNTFVHSKVLLTENSVAVGSVNMDMRAFYLEFDNGVYTDDKNFMAEVEKDFYKTFAENREEECARRSFFGGLITAFLRIFSPLM